MEPIHRRHPQIVSGSRRTADALGLLAAAAVGLVALAVFGQESRTVSAAGLRDAPSDGSYITVRPATNVPAYTITNTPAPREGAFITMDSKPAAVTPRTAASGGAAISRPGEAAAWMPPPANYPPATPARWGADAPREGSYLFNRPAPPAGVTPSPAPSAPLPWLMPQPPAPAYTPPTQPAPIAREVAAPAPARPVDPRDAGYVIVGPGAYAAQNAAVAQNISPSASRQKFTRDPADRGYNIIGPGASAVVTTPAEAVTPVAPVPAPPPRETRTTRRSGDAADAGYVIIGGAAPAVTMAAPLPATQAIPAPYALTPTEVPAGLSAPDRQALAPGVPLEQRRNVMQLYAKLGNVGMAEAVARQVFAEAPDDRATLLALASLYVEQQQTEKAVFTAQRLAALYPNDSEALYYLGAAYAQAGRFEEAQKAFTALKYEVPGAGGTGQPFKYQADLASAAYQAGDLRTAREAFQEVAVAPDTKEELRAEAQRVLKQLAHELDPQLAAEATGYLLGEGSVIRTKAAWQQPAGSRYTVSAQYSREDVHVNGTPVFRDRGTDSNDGTVSVNAKLNRDWSVAATVGGWEGGAQGGASVTRKLGGKGELKLEAALNERSLDSLLMESLDGREHRATLSASYLLHPRWLAAASVTGRETLVDDHQLGAGVNGNWNLEHIFLNDHRYLGLGYRGFYFRHSLRTDNIGVVGPVMTPAATLADRQAALANMIAPFLHREGGYVTWSHQLVPSFAWFAGGGADYELDRAHMAYNGLGGFTWTPFARLELRTELDYFTSARTSDQSSDLWQISLALRAWF